MTSGVGQVAERLGATREAAAPRRPAWLLLIAIALAAVTGVLLVAAPLPTFGAVVGGVTLVAMTALGRRSAAVFAGALGILLIAYAFMGRGVAYVGTGSVFIGEGVLVLGVIAFLLNLDRARFGLVQWLIVAFMIVGLLRTVPYVGAYGPLALRDAVVWGYAAFALILSATFDVRWLPVLTRAYRWVSPAFLFWVPLATAVTVTLGDSLPRWPGAPVPLIVIKQGDFAVQLAGIASFVLVGLYAARRGWIPSWVMWVLLFADVAVIGAVSRGGLVAAVVGAATSLLFIRSSQRVLTALGIALAGFVLLYALNPTVNVGSIQGRNLSFSQLVENAGSILSSSDQGNLEGTKAWRLAWWNTIVDYTIDGPYFWTGKGFGINLADADGFQVLADHSLREPHNGHLALLARGGVPLLAGWIAIQAAFGASLVLAARRAHRAGRMLVVRLSGVTFALWVAALINMSFDVYLEGPQGGIWFWSVIGLGLVLMRAARETEPAVEEPVEDGGTSVRQAPGSSADSSRGGLRRIASANRGLLDA